MEKEEEKKAINLEETFKDTMKKVMTYIEQTNPRTVDQLAETYELVANYRANPTEYMKKEIPLEYYVETQKNETWLQRHMNNLEAFGQQVAASVTGLFH